MLRSEFSTSAGTMLTLLAGLCTLRWSLLIVDAAAVAPFGRWNTARDCSPVGIKEANGNKACDVAPVSLTAKGIVPASTASLMLCCSAMLWRVMLSRGQRGHRCQYMLSLSLWFAGRLNRMRSGDGRWCCEINRMDSIARGESSSSSAWLASGVQ